MKAAEVLIIAMAIVAIPVWVYGVRQQWSRQPGSTAKWLKSGGLFTAIILTSMLAAYLFR